MAGDADGGRNGNGIGIGMLARTVADAVPGIVEQLRAARVLGLNRNTLRKRCRELSLPATRVVRRPRLSAAIPAH